LFETKRLVAFSSIIAGEFEKCMIPEAKPVDSLTELLSNK
jgi:hypothetical protein